MARITGMLTDKERDALPPTPLADLKGAERRARTAVSLFDLGIARGLLLGLVKEGAISDSQYDRMFRRIHAKVKPALLVGDLVVRTAPRTRRRRWRKARAGAA